MSHVCGPDNEASGKLCLGVMLQTADAAGCYIMSQETALM